MLHEDIWDSVIISSYVGNESSGLGIDIKIHTWLKTYWVSMYFKQFKDILINSTGMNNNRMSKGKDTKYSHFGVEDTDW